jgi:hypothetical protein
MAIAWADRGDEDRASTGACANELSTRAGEKRVHERGNDCGSGGFGSVLAGGADGGAGHGKATHRSEAVEGTHACGKTARVSAMPLWSKYSNVASSKAFHPALALSQWCEQSTIFMGAARALPLEMLGWRGRLQGFR